MPRYDYACTECGHAFEAVQSFHDAPLTDCPQCSGRLRKIFSTVGVVFKGSGFYRTDSRAGGSKPSSGAAEPATKPGEAAPTASEGTKSGGTKSGDTKSGDTKSGDTRSGGAKEKSSGAAPSSAGAGSSAPAAGAA